MYSNFSLSPFKLNRLNFIKYYLKKIFFTVSITATTFTLLIVIFAGTWSDKYNIRKIFILIPFIGEVIAQTIYIISSIYMNQIPIQYALYPASIVTAIFGSRTLFAIGIFSYMTVTTTEKDRTFRMGCYSMFYTFLGILTSPFSGILFEIFSYTRKYEIRDQL